MPNKSPPPPFARICRGFPGASALTREVALAIDDPVAYVAKFAKRLERRGIDAPVRELRWLALVDGLIARNLAIEIDHREEPETWLAQLRRLLPAAARRVLPSVAQLAELDPADNEALLRVTGDRLRTCQRSLICIDLRTDSYPVAIVATKHAPSLVAAAREAKGTISILAGADLPAIRRAHLRAARSRAATARRHARDASAGGVAWQRLLAANLSSFSTAVFALQWASDRDAALFVAAAADAPPKYRGVAEEIAALLSDPVAAARTRDPKRMLALIPKLPQTTALVAARIPALPILARRSKADTNPAAASLFMRACRLYTPHHAIARKAIVRRDWQPWTRLVETRFLTKRDGHAALALRWMGDQDTLARMRIEAAGRRGWISRASRALVDDLAKTYRT
jgi:hypothetical protein